MKILSLFDGMSVAQQALKDAGKKVDKYYASEIDEYAIAVTQSNFPSTIQLGSVVELSAHTEPFDLLIGGSPCQDLSIAKKGREGLLGARSGLFWEYVRIRDENLPEYFILENVASMPKEAKETISEALGVQPVMINASLVSAQNRKRLFWVGKYNGQKYEQVEIPQPEDMGILLKDILENEVDEKYYIKTERKNTLVSNRPQDADKPKANTLLVGGTNPTIKKQLIFLGGIRNKDWAKDGKDFSRNFGQGDRVYSPEGKSTTLSAMGGGRGAKTGLYAVALTEQRTEEAKAIRRENMKNGKDYSPRREKELVPRKDDKSNTITTGQSKESLILQDYQIRKLTPTECLRLQSMPDDYFDKATYKNKTISNTQRYKMCGNAFNKEVIVHIINNLK
jgi:DNA (cytosine-5)-methyltransferase 3A